MELMPFDYQIQAARFLFRNPKSALFADPGTGKTAIILMMIKALKKQDLLQTPVLLLAPLRVTTQVWPAEIQKWRQFSGISYQVIHGDKKVENIEKKVDIHLVNNETLPWLEKNDYLKKYRTLIIDESSKYKNWGAQRVKILRRHHFVRRHILTGSPTPRSLLDLFAQMYLVDEGESLGKYITYYRQEYFHDQHPQGPWHDWIVKSDGADRIYRKIGPRCWRLDSKQPLPELIINDIKIDIPKKLKKWNLETLRSLNLNLPINAMAEYALCRQIAGGITTDNQIIHTEKIEALKDLIDELQGKNCLVFFYYRAEGKILSEKLKAPKIDGTTSATESEVLINKWNNGEIPILLAHPASCGHGLNLQRGGNDIIWFSYTDNQDDYYQANRRIWRLGVKDTVRIHRLISVATIEIAMIQSLETKTGQQRVFLDAIKELQNGGKTN
jgi:SNF2 family DNA or RNA helicase